MWMIEPWLGVADEPRVRVDVDGEADVLAVGIVLALGLQPPAHVVVPHRAHPTRPAPTLLRARGAIAMGVELEAHPVAEERIVDPPLQHVRVVLGQLPGAPMRARHGAAAHDEPDDREPRQEPTAHRRAIAARQRRFDRDGRIQTHSKCSREVTNDRN
jgi:hypothetical protein